MLLGFLFLSAGFSQTETFKENSKWGIKGNGVVLVPAIYDSVFNFNVSNQVCLACYTTMASSANKFIKTTNKVFVCNYLDRKGKRLFVKTKENDTCSVFILGKNTVKQFSDNPSYFIVSHKNKKYLLDLYFRQKTYQPYHDIEYTLEPNFLLVKTIGEGNLISAGLVTMQEEPIVPFLYSEIKLNPKDSLIVACSAIVRPNAEDDIYNYEGKKIASYKRHIEMATKNFVIHKMYEPKEYFIVYNIENKQERILNGDEIKVFEENTILMRNKDDWYFYNMLTGEKKYKR